MIANFLPSLPIDCQVSLVARRTLDYNLDFRYNLDYSYYCQVSLVARRTDATRLKHPGQDFGSSHSVRSFFETKIKEHSFQRWLPKSCCQWLRTPRTEAWYNCVKTCSKRSSINFFLFLLVSSFFSLCVISQSYTLHICKALLGLLRSSLILWKEQILREQKSDAGFSFLSARDVFRNPFEKIQGCDAQEIWIIIATKLFSSKKLPFASHF